MKIFKIISNVIFLICAVFFAYISIDVAYNMLQVENGGLAVLGSVIFFIYGAPVMLYFVIYTIIMIVKRKSNLFDLICGLLFILSYASLLVVPAIIS